MQPLWARCGDRCCECVGGQTWTPSLPSGIATWLILIRWKRWKTGNGKYIQLPPWWGSEPDKSLNLSSNPMLYFYKQHASLMPAIPSIESPDYKWWIGGRSYIFNVFRKWGKSSTRPWQSWKNTKAPASFLWQTKCGNTVYFILIRNSKWQLHVFLMNKNVGLNWSLTYQVQIDEV